MPKEVLSLSLSEKGYLFGLLSTLDGQNISWGHTGHALELFLLGPPRDCVVLWIKPGQNTHKVSALTPLMSFQSPNYSVHLPGNPISFLMRSVS